MMADFIIKINKSTNRSF